ncbi:hypothetical protein [Amycolatopsis australiensis]|uniref:Uncharacterized protein n=1 Tax=Amycolatopsis australiensis TaxID=546364 RepID=A0A1K1R5X0_9PSEU|nr:hypothetical protein [Amycolatopsis australiensis]SFW67488.1 hypothetical protein SAMN04489730_2732 [Amycolatopsis australiensis]
MHRRLLCAAAAIGAALTLVAAPADAATAAVPGGATVRTRAADPISDDEVRAILARMDATGTLSAEDRAALATRPEVADQVFVPSDAEVVDETAPAPAPVPGKTSCTYADRYISYPSTTHLNHVKWAVRVDWCYNGKTVSNIRHYDYLKDNGGGLADYQGLLQNQLTFPGSVHYEATLVKQAKIALCVVKYGCYHTYYPLERFTLGNNGSYRLQQQK